MKKKFHISQMHVFSVIDRNYNKFVGKNKNLDLI